ncbi:MAG TPA: alpha/beta fold hydrolase, partial [Pyrinomonadaceae bacterium]|nr:alpha/beta fold hydrolase [Pyrinomonadaceae bacterium]
FDAETDNTAAEDARLRAAARAARALASETFRPHPMFRGGHAQTLAAFAWPRRRTHLRAHASDEARVFEVHEDARLLGHCRWQRERESRPTLVLVHGLEGSSTSVYMMSTARLAYEAGFNVVRLNQRNCGATEHLTPTLYHSGLSGDFQQVVRELTERDRLSRVFLAGFSMGGNLVMKAAGEWGADAPRGFAGVAAVSPSLNLSACARTFESRANRVYHENFMRHLRARVRRKQRLFPALYDTRDLRAVRTVRQFDERYTAPAGGFADAEDYYARASALPLVPQIRVPTLVVHALDDPLVPLDPEGERALRSNPYVVPVHTPRGGHVAFLTAEPRARFWAEHMLVEFCRAVAREDCRGGRATLRRARVRVRFGRCPDPSTRRLAGLA